MPVQLPRPLSCIGPCCTRRILASEYPVVWAQRIRGCFDGVATMGNFLLRWPVHRNVRCDRDVAMAGWPAGPSKRFLRSHLSAHLLILSAFMYRRVAFWYLTTGLAASWEGSGYRGTEAATAGGWCLGRSKSWYVIDGGGLFATQLDDAMGTAIGNRFAIRYRVSTQLSISINGNCIFLVMKIENWYGKSSGHLSWSMVKCLTKESKHRSQSY